MLNRTFSLIIIYSLLPFIIAYSVNAATIDNGDKTNSILSLIVPIITSKRTTKDPIKIGVAGAHSGDLASYGLPTLEAAKTVAKEINKKGGIEGNTIELFFEDDACYPDLAVNAAKKLVSLGVHAVIGHLCSGATRAALPIYNDAGILVISSSATNPSLTEDFLNFFRTIPHDGAQAETLSNYAVDILNSKKLAIIHDFSDYGKGTAELVRSITMAVGKSEVVLFEGVTPGSVDFSATVTKIKNTLADTVIFCGYHPEGSRLLAQMRYLNSGAAFLGSDGVFDKTFIDVAGSYAEGAYATAPEDITENAISQEYHNLYIAAEGSEPGAFFDNAVAAMLVLSNAFEHATSRTLSSLANIMHSQSVGTPFGPVRFDSKGDPIGIDYSVYQVRSGEFVQIQ